MQRRLRVLFAAAFVALFLVIPSPTTGPARAWFGVLQTRAWLLDAAGPLAAAAQDGAIGPLAVELRLSPPDPDLQRRYADELARVSREWATASSLQPPRDGQVHRFDPALEPLPLLVRVGEHGVRAELASPAGVAMGEWRHPDARSLVPAFLAVVVAILSGAVVPALLLGCLVGAALTLHAGGATPLAAAAGAPWHLVSDTLWNDVLGGLQVTESAAGFQVRVILFVVLLFMAIGVMNRSGGIQGMVRWTSRYARGPVSTQLCTWCTGLLIFFDDYSNCIVAGTTMQPLGDRNRVSREKIAWIVDSTAAPIAGLSIFSTWIAYEISQYRVPLTLVTREDGTPYLAADAYEVFVQTVPFRFYCLFTLALIGLVVLLRRDFGPMLAAERRARWFGKPIADDARPMVGRGLADAGAPPGAPLRARNAVLPVLTLLAVSLALMFVHGAFEGGAWAVPPDVGGTFAAIRWILGHAETEQALLSGSLAALVLAAALAIGQRILPPAEVARSALRSARALGPAIAILLLAWCIGRICQDLGTSSHLTAAFREQMSASVLPILMFAVAGLIAFSTGTSFGTMAILLPNVVVLAHTIGAESAIGGPALMILTIGAVLEGSIFGDHCSPISDTTVLSSLGTQCDHLHHVQTQMPYALLSMAIAALFGYLPMTLLGTSWWWLSLLLGVTAMATFLLVFGRSPDAPE